jgi:hypothetical protein
MGVNYREWIIRGFCGYACKEISHQEPKGNFLRHCIMARQQGVVEAIDIDESIKKKIIDHLMFWQTGDTVDDHLVHKFGILFMEFATPDELVRESSRMQELVKVRIS